MPGWKSEREGGSSVRELGICWSTAAVWVDWRDPFASC
jgi:hypothetical protein